MDTLHEILQQLPAYARTIANYRRNEHSALLGMTDEMRILVSATLFQQVVPKILYLTAGEDRAKRLAKQLDGYLPPEQTGYFPLRELLPYEGTGHSSALSIERIRIYEGLLSEKPFFAVVPVEAMSQRIMPVQAWRKSRLCVAVGERVDISELAASLAALGYERQPLTEVRGEFSQRGSIVDVYPLTSGTPYRIDFFDDEVDSIRPFDPDRQVSSGSVEQLEIGPASECMLPGGDRASALAALEEEKSSLVKLKGNRRQRLSSKIAHWRESLAEDLHDSSLEHLLPFFYPHLGVLEDYLPPESLIIVDEGEEIMAKLKESDGERLTLYGDWLAEGEVLPSFLKNFRESDDVWEQLNEGRCLAYSFLQTPLPIDILYSASFPLREFSFYQERQDRGKELLAMTEKGRVVLCAGENEALRLMENFAATWEITNYETCHTPLEKSAELQGLDQWLIAEKDLIGYTTAPEPRKKRKAAGTGNKQLTPFVDLKEGDYIVHDTHGIGQYMGIERLRVGEVERDYIHIRYSGKDKLYIPTDQMDMLQKYIGGGETTPRVNKLGGKEWQRTKERVRLSVQDMAKDLLKLYGERAAQKGFAFSPDSSWQLEMENDFPYEETEDQAEAIADVKADMEKQQPMERLLCGDVGYGKTEVALRAAFKAALDSKQTAILVPTTILAQQHERTFRERLEKFGVRIGVLSRFKSQREITDTIAKLKDGRIDIVIGTHMLFGKRVEFRDLGLLIVDEEQRFGVAHKEKIKRLKKNVDVLAMSATPIPRTLHLSLLGVRDISIIETPPPLRQPVQTYVMERHRRVIREALMREMAREGQVYFIHNRIETIYGIATELRELLPEANILIGHGQMAEAELEDIMVRFLNGEGDILLSTTIVESGLDFPNVNTLIVDDADNLGLSQLYQLRGRVGRSRKQAYAYFFYNRGKLLALPARKRLAAIRDYTDLGSGFKIALRDMEIRGAGNILGAEQHGHLASVGFDMYCQLIDDEVRRLKGEEVAAEKDDITIDIACSAFLPADYIGDDELKLEFYRRIAEVRGKRELKELIEEMEDRFGPIPDSVYYLFLTARLKLAAEKLEITTISQQNEGFVITFKALNSVSGTSIAALGKDYGRRFSFKMGDTLQMTVRCPDLSPNKALSLLIKILDTFIKRENEIRV